VTDAILDLMVETPDRSLYLTDFPYPLVDLIKQRTAAAQVSFLSKTIDLLLHWGVEKKASSTSRFDTSQSKITARAITRRKDEIRTTGAKGMEVVNSIDLTESLTRNDSPPLIPHPHTTETPATTARLTLCVLLRAGDAGAAGL
jgi:hypothetical protein